MKYTHKELREMIKAQILQELDGGLDLKEAKKKKEEAPEGEDASAFAGTEETSFEDVEGAEAGVEGDAGMDIGSPEMKKVSSTLTDAYKAAKELGDEKLIQQVANTIKYFNDNVLLGS